MPLVRGYSDDIKLLNDINELYSLKDDLLHDLLVRLGLFTQVPCLLRASFPTPTSLLHIEPSVLESGDGTAKSILPIDGNLPITTITTIDFQSGATTGQVVLHNGAAFALPPSTFGYYRRFVLSLKGNGDIDTLFSSEEALITSLSSPVTLLSGLPGKALGWLDLVCDDEVGKFRTAGSLTPIIENKVDTVSRIYQFVGSSPISIDSEITARINADSTLQANIDAEATTRANADSTLQANIDSEITARINADSTLQAQIDAFNIWNTKIVSSSDNVISYDEILADSSISGFTLTLPSSMALGDRIRILDAKATWGTNNVIIARNGNKIGGIAQDFILDVNNRGVELIADGIDNWLIISVNILSNVLLGEVPAGSVLAIGAGEVITIPST